MRATTVGIVLLLVLFCGGIVALGGYGGFEMFRVTSSSAAAQQDEKARDLRTEAEVAADAEAALPRCDEGKLALAEKRFEAAADALESCVSARPDQADVLFDRARAYAGLERYERAEADLTRALDLEGNNKAGWETLAWVRIRMGNDSGAVSALDHWLALDPAAGEAYRSRADALYRLGRGDLAEHDARKACDLGVADGCVLEDRIRSVRR